MKQSCKVGSIRVAEYRYNKSYPQDNDACPIDQQL
jgi:hypothetical protein